jgi:hypothetical protein
MAGIPGMLVALVPSGAQVITTIGPDDPPELPGTTPQPLTIADRATNGTAARRTARLCPTAM